MHFKCGHHGQALWEASILRIHPKFLQCTIHPIKALHILVMLKLNPQLKGGIMDLAGLFSRGQLLMGSIPLEEGRVSSQRILIEDALQPRALPHCSQDHVRHCNGCTHCSHILLNSIKPFYTGSPLRARAPPAYFTGGGRRSPLTGTPGRPFEPVDATAINYVSDGSLHCLGVGAKRNPICRWFLRRQAGSMVLGRGAMCKVRPQKASCRPVELFASASTWADLVIFVGLNSSRLVPRHSRRCPGMAPPLWVSGAQADPLQLGCAAGVEGKCAGDPLQGSTVPLWCAQGACRESVAIVSEPQWLVVSPVTPALHLPHHRINVAPS